jgi:hypothetical protein
VSQRFPKKYFFLLHLNRDWVNPQIMTKTLAGRPIVFKRSTASIWEGIITSSVLYGLMITLYDWMNQFITIQELHRSAQSARSPPIPSVAFESH